MPAPLTRFEESGRTLWSSLEEGDSFLQTLAETYSRVRHLRLGSSVEGRSINALLIGNPVPAANRDTVLIVSGQHGLERASREAVFMLARDLASTDDPTLVEYLSQVNWLLVPTASPDRVGIDRANANGVNTNRDWEARTQPETQAIYKAIQGYRPVLIVDAHEGRDFTTNFATSAILDTAVNEQIRSESVRLNEAVRASVLAAGRTHSQYPLPSGLGLLSTAAGIFGAVGLLVESRRTDDDTKPPPSERVGDQEIALNSVLQFHQQNIEAIAAAAATVKHLSSIPLGGPGSYKFRTGGKTLDVVKVKLGVGGKTLEMA